MSSLLNFNAHGKLLLTGEYLVMEGARGLALPLKMGQTMQVKVVDEQVLIWEAYSAKIMWFRVTFAIPDLSILSTDNQLLAKNLEVILSEVFRLGSFPKNQGLHISTHLDFNPEYGFGSSSTLISLLSQWMGLDAYQLNAKLFGGSGYDIACASAKGPLVYSIQNNVPSAVPVNFSPAFHKQLYFVYLGNKQQSSREISRFKRDSVICKADIETVSLITDGVCQAGSLDEFNGLLIEHEALMSHILKRPTIQQERFIGYQGVVKSLGAWGGDFVLVTTHRDKQSFVEEMKHAGFNVVYPFADIVLSH